MKMTQNSNSKASKRMIGMPLLILGKLQVPKLPIMALNGKDFARLIRSLRSLVYKTIWQTDDVSFGHF